MKFNRALLVAGVIAIAVAGFFLGRRFLENREVARVNEVTKSSADILVRRSAARLGREGAPVTVVEFFDPECESCRAFHPMTKMLLEEFQGKVLFVFRYAPFHPNSRFAIQILEAARKQNRYWETLDLLYQYQPQWGDHHNPRPELIWQYITKLELDIATLKVDMNSPDIEEMIKQDIQEGQTLGVRMTPSFFVNGVPLTTFGYEPLRQLILKSLAQQP
jgi:protein-disulfide isomerase